MVAVMKTPPPAPTPLALPATPVETLIVGSGFSGLCLAIKLHEAGRRDLVVLEKAESLGGTWRDNTYPGCACDVPSYLYSYSFAPSRRWTRMYAESAEIRAYLEQVATDHGVRGYLRFGAELTRATWDGQRWRVEAADGRAWSARFLVLATGGLSRPQLPSIEGLSSFAGPWFHTAQWRHDVPLAGRRVAIIGTGASAIQVVPHVAREAAQLHVFQRTPPWIVEKGDHTFGPLARGVLAHLPPAEWLLRRWIYARLELRHAVFSGNATVTKLAQRYALRHLRAQVADTALRDKLTPRYALGCKRVLISNDYYPALTRPNVELVTDRVARIVPEGVVTADGTLRAVDAIVYGTGFAVQEYLGKVEVHGRDGRSLAEAWARGAEAYKGTTVAGFPNMFLLGGPNTGLGHSSVVYMAEAQVQYVLGALAHLDRQRWPLLDVRAEAQATFNAELAERLSRTVWSSGCGAWYTTPEGRNTTLWPGHTYEFKRRLAAFDAENYLGV